VKKPKTAKAAKKKYVPPWSRFSNMRGETTPMMLFAVVISTKSAEYQPI